MNKTIIITSALGVAAVVAAGVALYGSDAPTAAPSAQAPAALPVPLPEQRAAQSATAREAAQAAPQTTQTAQHQGPRIPALTAPVDTSAFFHRPYQVENVCDGYEYRVMDDGQTMRLKKCRSVDRNPSQYRNDPTEQLLADIDAGQPWAIEAMEVLGMRFMAQGNIYAGLGMLKEHAARTGKVGLLAVAQLTYMHGTTPQDSRLNYEIMRILTAKGHPAYLPRRVDEQRTRLLNAGFTPEQLDDIDARIDRYIGSIAPSETDPADNGGAS